MGQLFEWIRNIIIDLKESWYFRIWSFLWLVCFLATFSGLIILSQESDQSGKRDDYSYYVQNASSLQFPRFHIRISGDSPYVFNGSVVCYHKGFAVFNVPCDNNEPTTKCVAVNTQ